jgi:predicted heme/steroid binding protein
MLLLRNFGETVKHYEHWAGQDLTDELKDAPHTEMVFEKFKPIGTLKAMK